MTMTTKRGRRTERDLLRTGEHSVEHHQIPVPWTAAFERNDLGSLRDGEEWNDEAARSWCNAIEKRGFEYSTTTNNEPGELGRFEGQWGTLIEAAFINRKVIDADEKNSLFCITGCDEGPTEYVLRNERDGVVRLPTNFEDRLLDPNDEVDDPRGDGQLPSHVHLEKGESGPRRINEGSADARDLDAAWTNEAADAAALALAREGWTIEMALCATTRQGWYRDLYGETMLFVVTKDNIEDVKRPTVATMGINVYTNTGNHGPKTGQKDHEPSAGRSADTESASTAE